MYIGLLAFNFFVDNWAMTATGIPFKNKSTRTDLVCHLSLKKNTEQSCYQMSELSKDPLSN